MQRCVYVYICICVDSSWCNAMHARITADELARDVSGAEALISRHKENKMEIDARVKDITRFTQKGKALIADKNFMASEVCSGTGRVHFIHCLPTF